MESYKTFIASSNDQNKQIAGAKRTLQASGVDIFEQLSAKSDLYDHLKNHLQVSTFVITTNLL